MSYYFESIRLPVKSPGGITLPDENTKIVRGPSWSLGFAISTDVCSVREDINVIEYCGRRRLEYSPFPGNVANSSKVLWFRSAVILLTWAIAPTAMVVVLKKDVRTQGWVGFIGTGFGNSPSGQSGNQVSEGTDPDRDPEYPIPEEPPWLGYWVLLHCGLRCLAISFSS